MSNGREDSKFRFGRGASHEAAASNHQVFISSLGVSGVCLLGLNVDEMECKRYKVFRSLKKSAHRWKGRQEVLCYGPIRNRDM